MLSTLHARAFNPVSVSCWTIIQVRLLLVDMGTDLSTSRGCRPLQDARGSLRCRLHPGASTSGLHDTGRNPRSSTPFQTLCCILYASALEQRQRCSMPPARALVPLAIRLGWAAGLKDARKVAARLLMPFSRAASALMHLMLCACKRSSQAC